MKIQNLSPLNTTAVRRAARGRPGSSSFAEALSEGPDARDPVTVSGQVGALNSLLSVQEVEDWDGGKKRALERGADLLDQLEELRTGLLLGRVPAARIQRLASRLKEQCQEHSDPRLSEIIAEIELRAAVELAKLELRSTT